MDDPRRTPKRTPHRSGASSAAKGTRARGLRVLRWLARGWSLLSFAVVALFFVGELVAPTVPSAAPLAPGDWLAIALFPVGVLVGLGIGWRREGLGGAVALSSLAGFYGWMWLLRGRPPGGPWFALLAAPAALFLLLGWLERPRRRSPG